jgi:hypothetical protein
VRYGATVSSDGTLVISWGLTRNGFHNMHVSRLDLESPSAADWSTTLVPGEASPFRYPYIAQDTERFLSLVAENLNPGNGEPNLYRKLRVEQASLTGEFSGSVTITDFADDSLPWRQLVRVRDLVIDADGRAHALLLTYLDPTSESNGTVRYGVAEAFDGGGSGQVLQPERDPGGAPPAPPWSWTDLAVGACDAPRLILASDANEPLIACVNGATLRLVTLSGELVTTVRLPANLLGPELFTAEGRLAAARHPDTIDLLVLAASPAAFPNAPAVYLSLPRPTPPSP